MYEPLRVREGILSKAISGILRLETNRLMGATTTSALMWKGWKTLLKSDDLFAAGVPVHIVRNATMNGGEDSPAGEAMTRTGAGELAFSFLTKNPASIPDCFDSSWVGNSSIRPCREGVSNRRDVLISSYPPSPSSQPPPCPSSPSSRLSPRSTTPHQSHLDLAEHNHSQSCPFQLS